MLYFPSNEGFNGNGGSEDDDGGGNNNNDDGDLRSSGEHMDLSWSLHCCENEGL